MEVKEWTYEEFPEFDETVEGVGIIETTGEEMGVSYVPNVKYAEIDGVALHLPPTLIFHGTKDRTVNCGCSVLLYRQMKKCKKDVQLYFIKGADHGGAEFWTDQVIDIVDDFLQECFRRP